MTEKNNSAALVRTLMFRLLPAQILLAAMNAINGIVSGYFASNYVGLEAMSAVGLYGPVNMLLQALSTMLVGGSVILCGKYIGQNRRDRQRGTFTLALTVSLLLAVLFVALFIALSLFDLTGIFTRDAQVRPVLNRYLLGQAIGVIPLIASNLLTSFLSMENKGKLVTAASLAYIAVNIALSFIFVRLMNLEAFGLSLAASLGLWVFLAIEAAYFILGKTGLKIEHGQVNWKETLEIVKIGLPGAAANGYQTLRGLIVNALLTHYVGSQGISAFAAANNLLSLFWAIPAGMLAVSRMLISVSVGEEDRQTLTDVMRTVLSRFVPIMCAVSALLILCAAPITRLYYRESAQQVYTMTLHGVRLLPLAMPFAVVCMHFVCYGQAMGKQGLVHVLSILDGVVCVSAFSALLMPFLGMDGVYAANILNGIVALLVIYLYARIKNGKIPRSMDELMVIPDSFGADALDRMDISVSSMEQIVSISVKVQMFCQSRGIDKRRASLSGLALEEMAGNIVEHGFTKGNRRKHSIDVRVIHRGETVLLRIKDDCAPFNPEDFQKMTAHNDAAQNIGIRMIYAMAREVKYQNILGLNVLTVII